MSHSDANSFTEGTACQSSVPGDGGDGGGGLVPGRLEVQQQLPHPPAQPLVQTQHTAVEDEGEEDEKALRGVEDGEEHAQHVQHVAEGGGGLAGHGADDGRGQAEDPGEAHDGGHLDVQHHVVLPAQLPPGRVGRVGPARAAVPRQAAGAADAGDGPGEEDAVHEEDEQDGRPEGEQRR